MKIITISDTHNQHNNLNIPDGDILIFTGDMSMSGNLCECEKFIDFFQNQKHKYKIFIAGNHDFIFEQQPCIYKRLIKKPNVFYLNDSGITINNINIWGSPITPYFCNWAFNRSKREIKKYWDLIPNKVDILLTHGSPYGILDLVRDGRNIGCKQLLKKVKEIKPKYHIFGHCHESRGMVQTKDTMFVNTSCLDETYKHLSEPIVINY